MPKTTDNLLAAFAGESQANRKYLAFAKKAEEDKKPNLAKLFRAAAEGETVHALSHLQTVGGINSTVENLEAAIAGETYEIDEMYPAFIATAEEENAAAARIVMGNAIKVEMIHQKLFREALESLKAGQDTQEKSFHICQVCGFPAEGEAPDRCPVCGAAKDKFFKSE